MRRLGLLPVLGLLVAGAPPPSNLAPTTPLPNFTAQAPAAVTAPPAYTTAPTPNDDASAPITRASKDASLAPGFFSRRDQYRGEGLSPGSSAQIEQDRRAKPGAGFSLRMPLQ